MNSCPSDPFSLGFRMDGQVLLFRIRPNTKKEIIYLQERIIAQRITLISLTWLLLYIVVRVVNIVKVILH